VNPAACVKVVSRDRPHRLMPPGSATRVKLEPGGSNVMIVPSGARTNP
jgi:hypothetical protein